MLTLFQLLKKFSCLNDGQVELYSLHPNADPSKAAAMQALEASIVRWPSLLLSPLLWLFWSGYYDQNYDVKHSLAISTDRK